MRSSDALRRATDMTKFTIRHFCAKQWSRSIAGIAVIIFAVVGNCHAQEERFELGKRLRRFEEAWQMAPEDRRAAAAPLMQDAVQRFFSLNLTGAAGKLDEAWLATDTTPVDPEMRGAIPFHIKLSRRVIGECDASIEAELARLYPAKSEVPAGCGIDWSIVDSQGKVMLIKSTQWEGDNPKTILPLADVPSGDYLLKVGIKDENSHCELPSLMFSRVSKLQERRDRLDAISQNRESPLDDSVRASLREHVSLFDDLSEGRPVETDYPINEILLLDEQLVADSADARSLWSLAAREHDVWMVLAKGRKRVPIRLRSPVPVSTENDPEVRMPVLFLLHGAGGSENMFFETYGAGRAVQCGLEHGWLVVAPRQSFAGMALDCKEMLDELEKYFPIDRDRIYLVGHSMGAAQVIRQVTLHPELASGAAVIGGGSATREAAKLKGIGWYIAAGELDFGRRGANAFYRSLQGAGAERLTYQEFPDVEHMVIVQAALDSMFKYFDGLAN
jgi:predicted esterase